MELMEFLLMEFLLMEFLLMVTAPVVSQQPRERGIEREHVPAFGRRTDQVAAYDPEVTTIIGPATVIGHPSL